MTGIIDTFCNPWTHNPTSKPHTLHPFFSPAWTKITHHSPPSLNFFFFFFWLNLDHCVIACQLKAKSSSTSSSSSPVIVLIIQWVIMHYACVSMHATDCYCDTDRLYFLFSSCEPTFVYSHCQRLCSLQVHSMHEALRSLITSVILTHVHFLFDKRRPNGQQHTIT